MRVERENFCACMYHFIERNILHVNKCFLTFFAVVSDKLNFFLQEVEWSSLIFLHINRAIEISQTINLEH